MDVLNSLTEWLSVNESAFSALAALIVIAGVAYGAIRAFYKSVKKGSGDNADGADQAAAALAARNTHLLADPNTPTPIYAEHCSLAVMLFQTLSSNEDDTYIASGISSEIIALVTPVPDIRVSSRLSSFQWKSGEADVQSVAEQLNAGFVLTGSLQRQGERIRVMARLTDVSVDAEVWAHKYDRDIEDLFDVQQDIARSIVGAVLGEVRLAETRLVQKLPQHQLDAWGLAQKAYHFWLNAFSPQGIFDACDYLRQALEIDPEYATARAALAMLLTQQMNARICEDYEACAKEAEELMEQAYLQAPNDIDVLENAGVTWMNIGQGLRAQKALRYGLELAPLNLVTRGYLALTLALTGGEAGAKEALKIIADNFATAPKHPSVPYWYFFQAIAEQRLGNHDEAIELAEKCLARHPAWVFAWLVIANAHCENNDTEDASAALQQAAGVNPFLTIDLYAQNTYRITGSKERAQPFIGGLIKQGLITA